MSFTDAAKKIHLLYYITQKSKWQEENVFVYNQYKCPLTDFSAVETLTRGDLRGDNPQPLPFQMQLV